MGLRHLGIGKETVFGTRVAPTDFFNLVSEDMQLQREKEDIFTLDVWSPRSIELTNIVRGSVEVMGNYHALGPMFKALYGAVTTTGANPYTHTFPPTSGIVVPRPTYSVEVRKDGSLNSVYLGCTLTQLQLSSSVDRSSRVNASFTGKSVDTSQSPATATYPTALPILHKDLAVTVDAAAVKCKSLELTFDFPVDEPYDCTGGVALSAQPTEVGGFNVTGRMEVLHTATTEYAKMTSFADVDIAIVFTSGTFSLTFNLNKAKLVTGDAPVNMRDRLVATYDIIGNYDATATEACQTILVNNDQTIP